MAGTTSRSVTALLTVIVLVAACNSSSTSPTPSLSSAAVPPTTPAPIATPTATPQATARPSPFADTWVRAGVFNDKDRVVTHLAPLGTGEVLVVGADNVCGVASDGSDSAEIGDPFTGNWSNTARLPSRRVSPVLVGLTDGRAVVTGGMTGENEGAIAKSGTLVFDPATRTWSTSGLLNTARIDPAATPLRDGRVLVAGGLLIGKALDGRALDGAELWDPKRGTWSRTGALSGPRIGPVAVTLTDGTVLVVGGLPSWDADVERTTAELYDPATGHWTLAGTLAAPRSGFSLVALPDGDALVVGGMLTRTVTEDGETFFPREAAASAERFDGATHTWSTTQSRATDSSGNAAAALKDGRVLAFGRTDAEIYDPAKGTWSATSPIPDGRSAASALLLDDGSVLVGGGWSEWPNPEATPSCPVANAQVWRFIPGS